MPKIVFVHDVRYGDWEGIYVEGILQQEGHSLDYGDVLTLLGIDYEELNTDVGDGGRLPLRLSSVVEAE